jgi:glycosyltransferase involved in cell wall biosynthesis
MNILIISPAFPPAAAGEAEHAVQIASRLTERGHSVSVVTNTGGSAERAGHATVYPSATGWKWLDLPRLAWRCWRLRPDAVLLIFSAWLYDNHPMVTFLPTVLRWLRRQTRVVVMVEVDVAPSRTGSLVSRVIRQCFKLAVGRANVDWHYGTLLRHAHTVVVLGPTMVPTLSLGDLSLQARLLVVPPPPLLARPRHFEAEDRLHARLRVGLAVDELVLAYFGYVYPGKGVETLIEALQLLIANGRRVQLLMVGGGRGVDALNAHAPYEARLIALTSQPGLVGHVRWCEGYDGASQEPSLALLAADMAVLPFDDGAELRRSSIAVVAAMGLPIITTRPTVDEPAFSHGDNAFLVPPRNPVALCGAVCRLADDPELASRLRLGTLDLVRRWYSWDTAIEKIERALTGPPPMGL